MPSPRLFGRDSSKQQNDEPGTDEIEDNLRSRKHESKTDAPAKVNHVGDLKRRAKRIEPQAGA